VSDPLSRRFHVSHELHEPDPSQAFFLARVIDDGYTELRSRQWATSERSLEGLGTPLIHSSTPNGETIVAEIGESLTIVTVGGSSSVYAQAAAHDSAAADAALDRIRDRLPAPEPTAAQDVPVMFWTYSPHAKDLGPGMEVRFARTTQLQRARRSMT